MAHPVRPDEYIEINNFYTTTVYEKGAEVIRMLHTLLGPEALPPRHGSLLRPARRQAVTCDDFVQAMHDASGVDLTQFKRWYAQSGTPVVHATGRFDAAARTYVLTLAQRTPPTPGQPDQAAVPRAVRRRPARRRTAATSRCVLDGEATAGASTRVLSLREARSRIPLHRARRRAGAVAAARLLGAGPGRVRVRADELAFLAAHDSDPFNRWEAAQRSFHCGAILAAARAIADGEPLPGAGTGRPRRHAARGPSERPGAARARGDAAVDLAYLAGLSPVIDADALFVARQHVIREIAAGAQAALRERFESLRPSGGYAPSQAQIGPRLLRNVCLRYLCAAGDGVGLALAEQQFAGADNMTDTIAALAAVNDSPSPVRATLLGQFEERWRDEPLVLDKWFALQATSARDDTLGRVRELLAHPRYNARNPNRVRALVASFALRNWRGFHAGGGAGYAFVANEIAALDRTNPMVAATLTGAFNQWQRHAEPRRSLQRAALVRIGELPGLSPDVAEIVARNLAA